MSEHVPADVYIGDVPPVQALWYPPPGFNNIWRGQADLYIRKAAELARRHHGPVKRWFTNDSYFGHVQRVAHTIGRSPEYRHDPEVIAAAYLHDILEDTALIPEDLHIAGMTARTINIASDMTKSCGVSYEDYLMYLADSPEAWCIKRADMCDNLSTLPGDESGERHWRKYVKGMAILHEFRPESFPSPLARHTR